MSIVGLPLAASVLVCCLLLALRSGGVARPAGAWLLYAGIRTLDLHQWLGALLAGIPVLPGTMPPPLPRASLLAGSFLAGALPLLLALSAAGRARIGAARRLAAGVLLCIGGSLLLGGGLDLAGKLLPAARGALVWAELLAEGAFDLSAAALFLWYLRPAGLVPGAGLLATCRHAIWPRGLRSSGP